MKIRYLVACLGVASVVLVGAVGRARAADEWFALAEKTLRSVNPSVEIKGEEGKLFKEDVKKVKLSVEGADVDITKVVLQLEQSPRRHGLECRSREVGRRNGSEGGSRRTRGGPPVGDGPVQDPWWCRDGQPQGLGIRLSGV